MKRIAAILLALSLLLLTCGCIDRQDMPFNGKVSFYDIEVTVPDRFVRDSFSSTDEMWIFEYDRYSEYILIYAAESSSASSPHSGLEKYMNTMLSRNAESEIIPFLDREAVISSYYKEDLYCREIFFYHNGYAYSVALRGGTDEAFAEIADSIKIADETNLSKE